MRRYVSFRDFDWTLLLFVVLICAVGVMQIYSATLNTKFAGAHIKQVYWILGGLLAMFATSRLNYQTLVDNVHWFYGVACIALVAVLVIGTKYLGAKRWIKLPGGVHFQPSEWVKLVLILLMAKFFHELRHRETNFTDIAKAAVLGAIPMLLVLRQPDLGTALTYTPIIIVALFLGGLQFKHAVVILAIAAALVVPVWRYGLKDYQRHRIETFMKPEADTQGKGYQSSQSIIAVGAGGIWGKGFAKGTQTQNSFVPIPQTDFIFATLAEEQGFVGAVGVLLLYFVVLMRLIANAQTAPDRAGAFVIMGVVAVLTFHILVNVGMVVGFMPVTGIPLPLLSYGGSSILFTFLALGIVMNIRMRRFVN